MVGLSTNTPVGPSAITNLYYGAECSKIDDRTGWALTKSQKCCCLVTCVCLLPSCCTFIIDTLTRISSAPFYTRFIVVFHTVLCFYLVHIDAVICVLYAIYSHVCCETFMLLSQLHPDLLICSSCKRSSSVGYRGETHSLNNCVFAENVLIKVDQRQARMWVGVNVMTLTIDFGIPPKLGRSLSQEFVP